jgi:hypothetical protein
VWAVEVLIGIVYGFGLFATLGATTEGTYVWYLAWKAKSAKSWRNYWFWKFRYQVTRYLRHVAPRGGRELFFKQQVRRFAATLGKPIPAEEVPGFRDIMRTLRQSGYELNALKSEKGADTAMAKDVRVLANYVSDSETFSEAFLRYAASMYLTLDPEDRALTRLDDKPGFWSRIGHDPIASRVLGEILAGVATTVVLALVLHFLR